MDVPNYLQNKARRWKYQRTESPKLEDVLTKVWTAQVQNMDVPNYLQNKPRRWKYQRTESAKLEDVLTKVWTAQVYNMDVPNYLQNKLEVLKYRKHKLEDECTQLQISQGQKMNILTYRMTYCIQARILNPGSKSDE